MAAPEIAMIKVVAPKMAQNVVDRAMQVCLFYPVPLLFKTQIFNFPLKQIGSLGKHVWPCVLLS